MSLDIKIEMNPDDLARVRLLLNEVDAAGCMRRAINKTLDGVRTDATRAVYLDLNLTQTRIRKNFTVFKASGDDLGGVFRSKGRDINFASFQGTRVTTRGLSVKIKRAGTRTIFRHAFIWTRMTKSGELASTAFERDYGGARTRSSPLLPWKRFDADRKIYRHDLITLTGPRIEDILAKPAVLGPLEKSGGERLTDNVNHELEYILSKHK
jgi:hypothetical protein